MDQVSIACNECGSNISQGGYSSLPTWTDAQVQSEFVAMFGPVENQGPGVQAIISNGGHNAGCPIPTASSVAIMRSQSVQGDVTIESYLIELGS